MPTLIIGAPIFKRAWILDKWLSCIENQNFPLKDIGFVFELAPDDEETHAVLWNWQAKHGEVSLFDGVIREDIKHKVHPDNARTWRRSDFLKMTELRNSLLDRVRSYSPDYYYSLDSDILLEDPDTLSKLIDATEHFDAVGTLSYMRPPADITAPSVMSWTDKPGGRAFRDLEKYPLGTLFGADVIMASKLMTPKCYMNANYFWHRQGEDLGWSYDNYLHGNKLGCASHVYTAHVMHEGLYDAYLKQGDPRSPKKLINL